ncbi:hypothetical protein BV898_17698 [Hypsibius exemplaris]|uniref:Uncharacterized protein n=1 Tax=Hypsibius exemplaris TaxID=2072580 RepID=A0A9X6NFK0_HYPEX|nr:hypothetical protein BV898_17698 [Hypsibius exemplaris]
MFAQQRGAGPLRSFSNLNPSHSSCYRTSLPVVQEDIRDYTDSYCPSSDESPTCERVLFGFFVGDRHYDGSSRTKDCQNSKSTDCDDFEIIILRKAIADGQAGFAAFTLESPLDRLKCVLGISGCY